MDKSGLDIYDIHLHLGLVALSMLEHNKNLIDQALCDQDVEILAFFIFLVSCNLSQPT